VCLRATRPSPLLLRLIQCNSCSWLLEAHPFASAFAQPAFITSTKTFVLYARYPKLSISKMHIQVSPNTHPISAGQIMAQNLRNLAGQDIRTTTFECADLAYGFEVEQLSERTSSTNTFSPATRELFGLDEIDLNNCMTTIPSPNDPSHRPPTPDLIADYSDTPPPVGPEPPSTPEPEINAGGFVSTCGKSTWPGKDVTNDGAEESEAEDVEDDDNDGFGGSQYGEESVQQAVAGFGGKFVRKVIAGFAGKSVSKTVFNNQESVGDDEEHEKEDEDYEHESDDGDHVSDSGSDYEDGASDNESETELVKALPKGGKTISGPRGPYNNHTKLQEKAEEEQQEDSDEPEQPG